MSKGKWPFRPSHLKLAIKTVEETGRQVRSVKISTGGFEIVTGEPEEQNSPTNEWAIPHGKH